MKRMIYCKDRHSNVLCLVECEAISEMTWHNDGIYIYVRRWYRMYDTIESTRFYNIKCEWTYVEDVEDNIIEYLQKHGTKIILRDDTIYEGMPESEDIGF